MKYWLYILYSESLDKYYVGSTSDLDGRIRRHLANHKGFTGSAKDWRLMYSEPYHSQEEAIRREKKIKSWKSKILVQKLISRGSAHPDRQVGEGHWFESSNSHRSLILSRHKKRGCPIL
jgi:putative endonuclease